MMHSNPSLAQALINDCLQKCGFIRSDVEEQRLRELVASGESVKSIANLMGRKVGAIRSRMDKLGL